MVSNISPRKNISIHALREEGDGETTTIGYDYSNFYPRPP